MTTVVSCLDGSWGQRGRGAENSNGASDSFCADRRLWAEQVYSTAEEASKSLWGTWDILQGNRI